MNYNQFIGEHIQDVVTKPTSKRGRPKGSKNKVKTVSITDDVLQTSAPRKRGRPRIKLIDDGNPFPKGRRRHAVYTVNSDIPGFRNRQIVLRNPHECFPKEAGWEFQAEGDPKTTNKWVGRNEKLNKEVKLVRSSSKSYTSSVGFTGGKEFTFNSNDKQFRKTL